MKVLHVIHGLGSGVERVVLDYATATPGHEHHALYSIDESCHEAGWAESPLFTSVRSVPGDLRTFGPALRKRVRELQPDVVHAHSSIAGAVARLAVTSRPVVYTAHGFAFLRRDVGSSTRAAFRLAEWLLARRTAATAACSPHEAELARKLRPRGRVYYVPNVAAEVPERKAEPGEVVTIVTSGRISPAKGIGDFAALARSLADRTDVRCVWVGGGDTDLTRQLEDAGVEVTGWLAREAALERLVGGDLYVHTAMWESAPLTVLEAAQADLPILARGIPAIRALGVTPVWVTTDELQTLVEAFLEERNMRPFAQVNATLRRTHTAAAQRASLEACYSDVLGNAA